MGGIFLAAGLVLESSLAAKAEVDVRRDAAVIAIEEVIPSVVNISTKTFVEVRDPFENLFRDFFGPDWGRQSVQSLGSGVIIDDTGYIITNYHVVRRASRITVTLSDKTEYEAKVVGVALKSDVALLKLVVKEPRKFKAIKFAADDDLLLGETVLALGNPFGLGGSVSRGILSSLARRPRNSGEPAELEIEDWLQTDAAINPGNSGGPLINLRGELVGIDVAVFREGQGIGFAIPVKRVSEALSEIFTPESVKSLWFGARFSMSTNGLTASVIQSGSPADKAGLKAGDRIVRINEKTPRSAIELNREIIDASSSDVQLAIQRGSERRNLKVRLLPEKEFFNANLVRQKIGVTLQTLTPELAATMGLGDLEGLLVAGVDKNGPGAEAEIRPGFLIQAIDGQIVRNLVHAAKILYTKKKGDRVNINLIAFRKRGAFVQPYSAATEVLLR